MPVVILAIFVFCFLFIQNEFIFFFNFFTYDFLTYYVSDFLFFIFNNFLFFSHDFVFFDHTGFQNLSYLNVDYDYNYRTYFTHTYLHAAYNKHMKPYRNLFSTERLFGDYNVQSYGKSKKHARALKHTKLFMLMYSHTLDCYAFNSKLTAQPLVMFYFKKQHMYSTLEMIYASLYLGMVYFLSFTYVRTLEESSLNLRETEEIDEELAQNHWYYFREDRRGIIEPAIDDNEEVNFAYPQHPIEWDDNGHFYRWELHFFIFLFSFLICWGVSQSAASMFFLDNFIDLHFMNWLVTFIFIFIFWRIFFLVQFFTFFNRFTVRRTLYLKLILPFWYFLLSFLFKLFYFYLWPFFYSIFFKTLKVLKLEVLKFSPLNLNLKNFSYRISLKSIVVGFYRFLYSAYQKNLNFFGKRNFYDYILTSNVLFTYNSKPNFDNIFYHYSQKDKIFESINSLTAFFVDNYKYNRGFFFPKNMYLTGTKITFSFNYILPSPFPFYIDYWNLNDLPIWGADFFFSQTQNVFGISESSESWFFSNHYKNNFPAVKDVYVTKIKNNAFILN